MWQEMVGSLQELRTATGWWPARKEEPVSYNYKEQDSAKYHMSVAKDTELQKAMQPSQNHDFSLAWPWAEDLANLDSRPMQTVR